MKFPLFGCLLLMQTIYCSAQAPNMVYDIYPGKEAGLAGVGAHPFVNGKLYFNAKDSAHGLELWSYDELSAPKMVYDLFPGVQPGTSSAGGSNFCMSRGKMYYAGGSNATGIELATYSGTGIPTIIDINPGNVSSYPGMFVDFQGILFFGAEKRSFIATEGYELFSYDGTNPPKYIRINDGSNPNGSGAHYLIVYKSKLYFSARPGATDFHMFSADQAGAFSLAKGTSLFTDSGPATLAGGKLYFTAYNPANGRELWSYDGDTAVRLTDIAPGAASGLGNSIFSGPILYNGSLYFPGGTDGVNYQLYAYNLATSVTSLVNAVHIGDTIGLGHNITYSEFTVFNNELFFTAYEPATGCELWHYDGTKTSLYADICAGTDSGFVSRDISYGHRIAPNFTEYNGHLYFRARDKAHGLELWRIGDLPSGVQAINWTGSAVFRPNPANSFAAIELNLTQAQSIAVILSDMTGRVVQRKAVTSYPPGKHSLKLDLNQLSVGQYLYRVLDAGGTQLSTGTFVKE